MKVVIAGSSVASDSDLERLKSQAAFRKATRKMMLVTAAVAKLSERYSFLHDRAVTAQMGLVLNSGFGELEATGGFLQAFSESGLALLK